MTRRDGTELKSRQTLKNYFSNGCLPTEKHFHALIESTLNMEDEGFWKTDEHGLRIEAKGGTSTFLRLLSFFPKDKAREDEAPWQLGLDTNDGGLQFARPRGDEESAEDESELAKTRAVLTLSEQGKVGVGTTTPVEEVDVHGTIRSAGRVGAQPPRAPTEKEEEAGTDISGGIPADGEWHNVTEELGNVHAFEVVAGVRGARKTGEYALVRAIAIGAFNPPGWRWNPFGFNFLNRKNRIRVHHGYYRSRRDRLELRWKGEPEAFYLQIRTRRNWCSEDTTVRIDYHVTDLWPESFRGLPAADDLVPCVEVKGSSSPTVGPSDAVAGEIEPPAETPEASSRVGLESSVGEAAG